VDSSLQVFWTILCIHFSSIFHVCYMTHPSDPPWFDHHNIWWSVQVTKFLDVQPYATSSLLGPNILLSTLFSNTPNLCSSISVRDQVSHPHEHVQPLYEDRLKSSWTGYSAPLLCCYASLCTTAAHCRQSTNFSNGPRSRSAILKRVRRLEG
jgi:hypothetical protein